MVASREVFAVSTVAKLILILIFAALFAFVGWLATPLSIGAASVGWITTVSIEIILVFAA